MPDEQVQRIANILKKYGDKIRELEQRIERVEKQQTREHEQQRRTQEQQQPTTHIAASSRRTCSPQKSYSHAR